MQAKESRAEIGLRAIAEADPDRPAIIAPDGQVVTFGELAARVNRVSRGLRSRGLGEGDVVAAVVRNGPEYVELVLATGQIGIHLVPVNTRLAAAEKAYIVYDSGAKVVIADAEYAGQLAADGVHERHFIIGPAVSGWQPYAELGDGQPDALPEHRTQGAVMGYTSGTTGRPKGVQRTLPGVDPDRWARISAVATAAMFGMAPGDGVHLICSPVYHSAPGTFAMAFLLIGHTLVMQHRFDTEAVLEAIEKHGITSVHLVPTHFHRLLQLPREARDRYDVSSLSLVMHAGAPCPVQTKRQMIDWLGPVVWEYLGATEGMVSIASPKQWLAKPGTVGRPLPGVVVKILDDAGNEQPSGEGGSIYFGRPDQPPAFEYHNDPAKTAAGRVGGLATVGDIGYLDEDGYLFLLDRRTDLIVSGGVNIYPAEVEQTLIAHPEVHDVAVIGVSDPEWGQSVLAVVQPAEGVVAGPELSEELLQFCREHVAAFKCPRRFEFRSELPRTETGKLQRRLLRDDYREGR